MQSLSHPLQAPHVAGMWLAAETCWGDLPCCMTRSSRHGQWQALSYAEGVSQARALATRLQQAGLKPGSRVGLFADHGQSWLLAHIAIQLAGCADVPRGTDVSDGDLAHIISATEMDWAFVANSDLARRVRHMSERPMQIVVLAAAADEHCYLAADLVVEGQALLSEQDAQVSLSEVSGEAVHTVIFTSATTGRPKGVVLTHAAMMAQLRSIAAIPLPIGRYDRLLSILPVWHIFERTVTLAAAAGGASVWFTSPRRFAEDLQNVRPTFMASAPRLWESLHQRIQQAVRQAHPLRRLLVRAGMWCSHHFRAASRAVTGREPQLQATAPLRRVLWKGVNAFRWLAVLPAHGLLNTAVLERIRQSTGACLKATVSGGGALPPVVDEFLRDLGIPVLEGYGMTEFPVISVRLPHRPIPSSVGPPLPEVRLRLVDLDSGEALDQKLGCRGEIQVQGPMCLREYWRDTQATSQALTADGWLRTGDIGMLGHDGCLRIVGRSKDTIVLRSGENVDPQGLEDALLRSEMIHQAVVVGQDAKRLAALVIPDLSTLAQRLGRDPEQCNLAQLAEDASAHDLLRQEVRRLISSAQGFKRFELIGDIGILPQELQVGDELTNLLKVRRHVVHQRYASLIHALCEGGA